MTRPLLFRTHSEAKEVKHNGLERSEAVALNDAHDAVIKRSDDSPPLKLSGCEGDLLPVQYFSVPEWIVASAREMRLPYRCVKLPAKLMGLLK